MTWDLPVARLQYWMDLTGRESDALADGPPFIQEGTDDPALITSQRGENAYKGLVM